jgi:hypothetical protein
MGSSFIRRPSVNFVYQSAATWLCSFLLYGRCSTVSSASARTSDRTHTASSLQTMSSASVSISQGTVSQLYSNHCNRSMTSLDRIVIGCDALGHSVTTTSITQGKLDSGPSYEGATYSNIHALTYLVLLHRNELCDATNFPSVHRRHRKGANLATQLRISERFNCRNLRVIHPLTQSVRTSDFFPVFHRFMELYHIHLNTG